MNKRQRQLAKVGKYPFKKRIQIWNTGYEFAKFIHGGLVQFRKLEPHGYPTEAGTYENWMNILDEMIWTFREIASDYPGSPIQIAFEKMDQNHPDAHAFHFKRCDAPKDEALVKKFGPVWYEMVPDHPDYASQEVFTEQNEAAEKEYRERIKNGLQLFSKYMENLWD